MRTKIVRLIIELVLLLGLSYVLSLMGSLFVAVVFFICGVIMASLSTFRYGETDEMYGHLPSTNNPAEATNSVESRFCKHNVELVPSIHDSYRMTLRQQKQHEGIQSGTAPTASACSY